MIPGPASDDAPDALHQIVLVRGVLVRVESGPFGFSLHAVKRGYFPCSETGFRSMSGCAAVTPEALEALAVALDLRRKACFSALDRASSNPSSDRLGNFLTLDSQVRDALALGLWASPQDRAHFWSQALRALDLLLRDTRLQPEPSPTGAWDRNHCRATLRHRADLRSAVRSALAGDVGALLPVCAGADGFILLGLSSYLTLPFDPSVDLACGITAPTPAGPGQLDFFG